MIKFITKAILTSVAVLFADYLLDGITIADTLTAMIVAVVLGLLNTFIKPIFIPLIYCIFSSFDFYSYSYGFCCENIHFIE